MPKEELRELRPGRRTSISILLMVCNMQLEVIQYIKLYQVFMEGKPKPYMRAYTNFYFANITCLPSSIPRAKTQWGSFLKFIILCIIPKCFEKTISRSKKVVKTALRLLTGEKNW